MRRRNVSCHAQPECQRTRRQRVSGFAQPRWQHPCRKTISAPNPRTRGLRGACCRVLLRRRPSLSCLTTSVTVRRLVGTGWSRRGDVAGGLKRFSGAPSLRPPLVGGSTVRPFGVVAQETPKPPRLWSDVRAQAAPPSPCRGHWSGLGGGYAATPRSFRATRRRRGRRVGLVHGRPLGCVSRRG